MADETRVTELEARLKEVAHAYDVTFKRRVELEAMLTELVTMFNPEPNIDNPVTIWDRAAVLART